MHTLYLTNKLSFINGIIHAIEGQAKLRNLKTTAHLYVKTKAGHFVKNAAVKFSLSGVSLQLFLMSNLVLLK